MPPPSPADAATRPVRATAFPGAPARAAAASSGISPADLAACRQLLADGSKSFFAASLLLPPRVRAPATALYAFCRVADDVVDREGGPAALARLTERLDRAYAGRPLDHPVDRAFAATVDHFALPRALPEALLDGFAWDEAGRRYETLADLEAYGVRVAGSVGAMMAVLMGVRDAAALARATDLGVAMQLTNIARDVGEDARSGRLYLPLAWLAEAGIEADRFLAAPRHSAALAGVVARLVAAADTLYARADAGIAALPRDCRPAIRAARLIYAEIGREVVRAGCDSVGRRAVVSKSRKLALAARAAGAVASIPWPDAEPPLAAARYVVEAAARRAPTRPAMAVAAPRGVDFVLDLFERLERQGQGSLGGGTLGSGTLGSGVPASADR
jgi:phytoene synthase